MHDLDPSSSPFELQGHRGARGFRPENTLPSFEYAIDAGADAIETDVLLTADRVPILCHEPILHDNLCRLIQTGAPAPDTKPLISQLTLAQTRCYRADVNPDPVRFPRQQAIVSPFCEILAAAWGVDPYGIPTVTELFAFVDAYAGPAGEKAGKTPAQQERARQLILDLELKRVPFEPELVGDDFHGDEPGLLEKRVVAEIVEAGTLARTRIRSFDHRAVAAIKVLEPRLETAVLISHTAPVAPAQIARHAGAALYCPDYRFVDEASIRQAHAEGIRVIPWTVNSGDVWRKLVFWEVDGITTDYPGELASRAP